MGEGTQAGRCESCGAGLEEGAKFCIACGAPVAAGAVAAKKAKKRRLPKPDVEPWAVKAGEAVKRVPTWLKVTVPCVVLGVVAVVVALLVLAGMHSPSAAVGTYLSRLQDGDYSGAYELTVRQGGRFSTLEYFEKWQKTQAKELGALEEFTVMPRKQENRVFGRLVLEEQAAGTPLTASLTYADRSFDVNITAEDAGGVWPLKKYRLKLSEQPTRILARPIGAKVYIDGVPAGSSTPEKALEDALSLKDFPDGLDEVVDYVKRLRSAVEGYIDSFKRIVRGLGVVEDQVQRTFNKFGHSGFSWTQMLDDLKRTVSVGRDVGEEIVRTFIHLYWTFGGSDDGTLRADLSRTQPSIEIDALPEGFHVVRVEQAGSRPQAKEFMAPEGVTVELKPRAGVVSDLEAAVEAYYRERSIAEFTLNNAGLPAVIGGPLLEEVNSRVLELATRGQRVASQLVSVNFENARKLSADVATIEAREVWNFTTYQDSDPVSVLTNVKQNAVYTLKQGRDGNWKTIERTEK